MARVNILGRSGTGKSWFAGRTLANILHGDADFDSEGDDSGFGYAIHIDLEDEERGLSDPEDPLLLTFDVNSRRLQMVVGYKSKSAAPDYIPDAELEESLYVLLPKWVYYKNRYVRVVPDGLSKAENRALVEMLADAAMKTGDCHFSLDEAHLVAEKHGIGDKLMRLVTGGRKRGVEWLFITQRPQKIHEDILSQSDYTVYFNLRDRDRDKAAEKSEAIPDAEREIASLGKREAIIEDFDRGEWHRFSTEGMERRYPHVSGDDGKADAHWEELLGETGADD